MLGVMMAGRTEDTHGGSGADLVKFLNEAMQRGLVPPQTGANYIVACKDILPFVLGEHWMGIDIPTLDMAHIRNRYRATKGDRHLSRFDEQFSPAVEEFRKHLGLPPSLERATTPTDHFPSTDPEVEKNRDVPKGRTDSSRRRRARTATPPSITTPTDPFPVPRTVGEPNGDGKHASGRGSRDPVEPTPSEESPLTPDKSEVPIVNSSPVVPSIGVIPHLFPLRDGMLATLLLPADLTLREARRLTAFIESLALSDGPELSNGDADRKTNGSAAMPASR